MLLSALLLLLLLLLPLAAAAGVPLYDFRFSSLVFICLISISESEMLSKICI
jgi:hypothetical protein